MNTEQVNLRLETDLIAAVEAAAEEESLDRATMIRRLLKQALEGRRVDRALERYQRGDISIGRAAEESGLTHWDIIELSRSRGIAYPLDEDEVEARLRTLSPRVAERSARGYRPRRSRSDEETLPDRPPKPGGVLLVGINPPPVSVEAGHYYQGTLGKRLWQRLERVGLLSEPVPGAEDDAFVRAGHGLTDVVKRPTPSAADLETDELRSGADAVRRKIREWKPSVVVFAFRQAARWVTGERNPRPGPGPAIEGVPTFLLSGPYAPQEYGREIENQLQRMLARR